MAEYRVTWEIDVDADSSVEAAEKALTIQRDSTSTATVFEVTRHRRHPAAPRVKDTIDLSDDAKEIGDEVFGDVT